MSVNVYQDREQGLWSSAGLRERKHKLSEYTEIYSNTHLHHENSGFYKEMWTKSLISIHSGMQIKSVSGFN